MKYRVGIECSQRWYWRRSWSGPSVFRTFDNGFAIGPIMFWKD